MNDGTDTIDAGNASDDATARLYDEWHQSLLFQDGEDQAEGPWHEMARPHLGSLKGLKVLEIGCGRGGFSRYLLEQGANLVAADFSESAVEITRQRLSGLPQWEARIADVQNIPYPAGAFDLVVSLETLEHVPDPTRGLAELVRVTRPGGGRLIITTPNYFGGLGMYRVYRLLTRRGYTEVGQPVYVPVTLKDRVRYLKRLGCRVDVVDGCGHYLYFPGRYPMRVPWLDNPRAFMKWFAVHSLTVATRI